MQQKAKTNLLILKKKKKLNSFLNHNIENPKPLDSETSSELQMVWDFLF